MKSGTARLMVLLAFVFGSGCGGGALADDAGSGDAGAPGDAATEDAGAPDDAAPDDAAPDDAAPTDGGLEADAGLASGAMVYVHLVASHAPVAHAPGSAGQTPRDWVSGLRSLHLLRAEDDPEPLLVFSHGDGYVEASYDDGADTVVGSARVADLEPGTFTWARVVHTHVRFTIDATMHAGFGPTPGALEQLIVLSDRTTLEGVVRERGDYRFTFRTAGMSFPAAGSGLELTPIASGGFYTRVEAEETAYYFPAHIAVADDLIADVHVVFEVNVHEGFRWTDEPTAGYRTDVFDTTPVGTEPIVQAGANSYRYRIE